MEKCFDAHPFPGSVGLKYLGKVRKDFLPTKKPRFDLSSRLEGCYASYIGLCPMYFLLGSCVVLSSALLLLLFCPRIISY